LRRASILAIAVLCVGAPVGGAASAQTAAPGQAGGLRTLSWSSRAAVAGVSPAAPATDARRSNRIIPHGGGPTSTPGTAPPSDAPRRTLTPATAWMRAPPPSPAPEAVAASPMPAAPPARAVPGYLPDQGGQAAPAQAVLAAPAPIQAEADPMAPRRDAPIFRLQRPGPAPSSPETAPPASESAETRPSAQAAAPRVATVTANPSDRPTQQGARYYSVHRQVGREPDPLSLPQPTYVDALAVTMAETPASQDLAQPTEPPAMFRDAQGRLRATAAASDGDHQ